MIMKQKLALGNQEFSKVINNNCIYVDKTELIYNLITKGDYYFLSRPRRFGKSLLANTIKELYLGNKELFKGLWIYDKWNWETTYPVIKISFSRMSYHLLGLETTIDNELDGIAKANNIILTKKTNSDKFEELIIKLSPKGQVAIIIDEYDKPIIDYLDNIAQASVNRDILKKFYSVLKDLDKYIKFFFVTGVSKFSQVSIFSDLNNLTDITLHKDYSRIVGWTKNEIEKYFPDYIKAVANEYKDIYQDIMSEIKNWYNGYSWDGINFVYNPVSLMNLFSNRAFRNYWFTTGTPTFLIKYIKKRKVLPYRLEKEVISTETLDKYEIDNITLLPLLFQTGYLTIKKHDLATNEYELSYPNNEVARSFSKHFLAEHTTGKYDITDSLLYKIRRSFVDNDIEELIENLNILFENIPYTLVERSEKYFHSLFFLVIKIIGFIIEAETLTIKGRIDAVVKTKDNIYIIEFKINQSADKAIQQIRDKKYALKYADDKRPISLLGINFDTDNKIIEDWKLIDN